MAMATPTNEEGAPVNRNLGIAIAVVVVLLVLAYALGWFGGGDLDTPAATTAPPAGGTGTTR